MFRSRWNNRKDNSMIFDRGEDCMQRHIYKHFQIFDRGEDCTQRHIYGHFQLPSHTGFS